MPPLTAKPYLRSVHIDPRAELDLQRYPFNIPAVRDMGVLLPHPDVTFFVGENGAGKSTVLEAIAVALGLPAEGGTRHVHRNQQETSPLHGVLRLAKGWKRPGSSYFLRAESLFNVFTYLDEIGSPRPSMHLRSHGEAFMDTMLGFRGDGLYLLDEPEAALSPTRQLAALALIDRLVKEGAQFIIATHSPILLAYPNAKICLFDGSGVSETAYEDTEHYAVTRDFLNHYPRRLQQLLGEE
ncbi:AAA family ATPase [Massilia sp. YIM B02763]|uniref:AAA family ATPase n=1 Tax=Massilia sp. YIM B02763 TaxID=3050130 RepID=UPI0025B6F54F|nr:AAA family ATPase [Massilia sp. YIM B02763]MDN4053784.1 AAA family ATPase [Massilia sp. YIM B02763]